MAKFHCVHCLQKIDAPDELAGSSADCPTCGGAIKVPPLTALSSPTPKPTSKGRSSKNGVILKVTMYGQVHEYELSTNWRRHESSILPSNYAVDSLEDKLRKIFTEHELIPPDYDISITEKKNGVYYEYYPPAISYSCLKNHPKYEARIHKEKYYEDGQLVGPEKIWTKNGELKYDISYFDGAKSYFREYHPNGKIKLKGGYIDPRELDQLQLKKYRELSRGAPLTPEIGIKDGVWTTWSKWGKKIKEERYSNGELVG